MNYLNNLLQTNHQLKVRKICCYLSFFFFFFLNNGQTVKIAGRVCKPLATTVYELWKRQH